MTASPALRAGFFALCFPVIWSTGFIGAKFGLPYAEPFAFLAVRQAAAIVLLLPIVLLLGWPWPRGRAIAHAAVYGVLVHGVYLGGVFWAISQGMPSGTTAMIVGLQPAVTAAAAIPLLGERVRARQWCGIALGIVGLVLLLHEKVALGAVGLWPSVAVAASLLAISMGTIYQKRFAAGQDVRSASVIQFAAAGAASGVLSLAVETRSIAWTGEFLFALGWLVVVLSIGAFMLLLALLRRGEATRVSSLFFLVPPCTAAIAWAMFGETLSPLQLTGMAVAAAGVALVQRS